MKSAKPVNFPGVAVELQGCLCLGWLFFEQFCEEGQGCIAVEISFNSCLNGLNQSFNPADFGLGGIRFVVDAGNEPFREGGNQYELAWIDVFHTFVMFLPWSLWKDAGCYKIRSKRLVVTIEFMVLACGYAPMLCRSWRLEWKYCVLGVLGG